MTRARRNPEAVVAVTIDAGLAVVAAFAVRISPGARPKNSCAC